MDKIKLTSYIKDIGLKNKMFKIIDKANGCLKNYDVRYSDFLNPFEVENAKAILNSNDDLKYSVDGGYDESERKIVFIYPFYMEYEDIDETLRFIQIEGNFKFKSFFKFFIFYVHRSNHIFPSYNNIFPWTLILPFLVKPPIEVICDLPFPLTEIKHPAFISFEQDVIFS